MLVINVAVQSRLEDGGKMTYRSSSDGSRMVRDSPPLVPAIKASVPRDLELDHVIHKLYKGLVITEIIAYQSMLSLI